MSLTGVRILVLDDSQADFLLIRRRLEQAGHSGPMVRVDSSEALTRALENDWDVVLFDYEIPGWSFEQELASLRERLPDAPVILVSGTVDEAMAIRLLDSGLTDFVLKDNPARLPRAVARAVEESANRAARRSAENELRKLARVVEQSPTSIVITDTQARIEYVNEAVLRSTGYAREELIGQNPRIFQSGHTPEATYRDLWRALERGQVWHGELQNRRKDGSEFLESMILAPIRQPGGEITHYVSIKQDITAQRESEAMVEQLAYFDRLTGLPNRVQMLDQIKVLIEHSPDNRRHHALLLLDLDGFKFVNDIKGHQVGDRVLKETARRLTAFIDSTARTAVARIAGDQFALLVGSMAEDEAQALALARDLGEQIQRAIEVPVPLERGEDLKPSSSLGIFLFDRSETSQEMILSRAEIALQHAKEGGRGQMRFYSPELQSEAEIRTSMEAGLRLAIERGELSLNLQGQYRADGRLIGAEALLRWQHAGTGVSPGQFIPLAESTGLIVPIGRWVIEQACALLLSWQGDAKTQDLTLAINISARQFQQPDFSEHLRDTLESTGVHPARLKLELTESVVFGDRDLARRRMREIRELGVRLSMDDFGTGYSSLSYLQYLPFDQLKIDQSFIAGMARGDSNLAIVRAILALGKALKLNIIAEGVENCQQLDLLLREGCDSFQGYLFDRPQPSDQWQPQPARAALDRCQLKV